MNGRNVTKRKKVSVNKKKLWNAFDNAMDREEPTKKLERLYSLNELGSRQTVNYAIISYFIQKKDF